MATESAAVSVHNTLSSTTADRITIGTQGIMLAGFEVQKRAGSATVYFTYTMSTKAPTTAVSAANDTHQVVSIGEAVFVPLEGKECSVVTVSIVGDGNEYSIRGVYL
jgi:hypothetical protein